MSSNSAPAQTANPLQDAIDAIVEAQVAARMAEEYAKIEAQKASIQKQIDNAMSSYKEQLLHNVRMAAGLLNDLI